MAKIIFLTATLCIFQPGVLQDNWSGFIYNGDLYVRATINHHEVVLFLPGGWPDEPVIMYRRGYVKYYAPPDTAMIYEFWVIIYAKTLASNWHQLILF